MFVGDRHTCSLQICETKVSPDKAIASYRTPHKIFSIRGEIMGAILDMIVSSVAIITTKSGEKINGMTAAWVAQASFEPPLVVVSIAPERYTHQLIDESSVFAVNILSEGQVELGRKFGSKSGRDTDKFKDVNYVTKKTGSPILADIYAYLDCKLYKTYKAGDHTLFIGEVVEHKVFKDKKPLVFRTADYF